ncbi:hypothetical protein SCP_0704020 [Sparassis crispa]|uniref:Uncharacterized protein n=1 Tax=Sparassis crispa TaxID=139825 RepID=A0A401GSM4_9APHY|nr:hypothetical protein SCP_0704020 [Sparassis crispa]GBE85216.1 hypothetical protein SCP_0704020 [Sparassis crispa]
MSSFMSSMVATMQILANTPMVPPLPKSDTSEVPMVDFPPPPRRNSVDSSRTSMDSVTSSDSESTPSFGKGTGEIP